jgi:hypothetical protein
LLSRAQKAYYCCRWKVVRSNASVALVAIAISQSKEESNSDTFTAIQHAPEIGIEAGMPKVQDAFC